MSPPFFIKLQSLQIGAFFVLVRRVRKLGSPNIPNNLYTKKLLIK